jgi:hypothetical protein
VSPEFHGAWRLEMAYDPSRADLGPGQLLLLPALGRTIDKGHRHLSFMQNFAHYKHRLADEPIDAVNIQLIRRLSRYNFFGSSAELRRKLTARPQRENRVKIKGDEFAEHTKTLPSTNQQRGRELASVAMACAGTGVCRLDRGNARPYLPFDLE